MDVTVMTDASFCHKTSAAGYGYWIASARGKRAGGGPFKKRLSGIGVAEMSAVCNALFVAVYDKLVMPNDEVLVQLDSLEAIFAFQGKRKKLKDEEQIVKDYFSSFCTEHKIRVRLRHVKGHTAQVDPRFKANAACDRRARRGLQVARKLLAEEVVEDV